MPFLSYHTKISTKASNFPRSHRNLVAGESHPCVPTSQGLRGVSQQSPW